MNPRFSRICALVEERQKLWFIAINRSDLFQSAAKRESYVKFMFVCERHFESGKPASLYNKYDVDWVPRLNMGYSRDVVEEKNKLKVRQDRHKRLLLRGVKTVSFSDY
jgi:hypothetical protein